MSGASPAFTFVLTMGIVNLFADVTYEGGASIRNLVATTGRSYGSVHSMLLESGTTLRGRGGPNHTSRRSQTTRA